MKKPAVIAIAGATASGKSALALEMAKRLNGELICMDSMQIYRGMDIGTAKPTPAERAAVPHHMLDIVEPTQTYAVADYATDAERVIAEVASRGKLPMLVGGTGLYLKALMHGLQLGGVKGDEALRARYHAIAEEPDGKERLHHLLQERDSEAAARLHPNDLRRVIRALEVYELTGEPLSRQTAAEPERPFRILPLATNVPRETLYERLERRVESMLEQGLLDEVRRLLDSGVPANAQSMQGIGYKELIPVLTEGHALADATRQIVLNTRHYAKRQGTWLRTEAQIVWLNEDWRHPLAEAMRHAEGFLTAETTEKY